MDLVGDVDLEMDDRMLHGYDVVVVVDIRDAGILQQGGDLGYEELFLGDLLLHLLLPAGDRLNSDRRCWGKGGLHQMVAVTAVATGVHNSGRSEVRVLQGLVLGAWLMMEVRLVMMRLLMR